MQRMSTYVHLCIFRVQYNMCIIMEESFQQQHYGYCSAKEPKNCSFENTLNFHVLQTLLFINLSWNVAEK